MTLKRMLSHPVPEPVELVRAVLSPDSEVAELAEDYLEGLFGTYEDNEIRPMLAGWVAQLVSRPRNIARILNDGQGVVLKLPLSFSRLVQIIDSIQERSLSIHREENGNYLFVTPGTAPTQIPSAAYRDEVAFALSTNVAQYAAVRGHSHPRFTTAAPTDLHDIAGASNNQDTFIICLIAQKTIDLTFKRAGESLPRTYHDNEARRVAEKIGLLSPSSGDASGAVIMGIALFPFVIHERALESLANYLLTVLLLYHGVKFLRSYRDGLLLRWVGVASTYLSFGLVALITFVTHIPSYFKIKPWRDYEPIAKTLVEREEARERGDSFPAEIEGPVQDVHETNWVFNYERLKPAHWWLRERDHAMNLAAMYDFKVRIKDCDDAYLNLFGGWIGMFRRIWTQILTGFTGYGGILDDQYLQPELDLDRVLQHRLVRLSSGIQAEVSLNESRDRLVLQAVIPPDQLPENIFPAVLKVQRGGIRGEHQYVIHDTSDWGRLEIRSEGDHFEAVYIPEGVFARWLIEPLLPLVDVQNPNKMHARLVAWVDELATLYRPHGLDALTSRIHMTIYRNLNVSYDTKDGGSFSASIPLERVIPQYRIERFTSRVRRIRHPWIWQKLNLGTIEEDPFVIAARLKSQGSDRDEIYAWVRLLEEIQKRIRRYERQLPKYPWTTWWTENIFPRRAA
jgi:hypothetical protein